MGMTAAGTLSVAAAVGVSWPDVPGEVLLWVAVTAWLAVTVGAVRSAGREIRSTAPR
jgi:hypothetical protein